MDGRRLTTREQLILAEIESVLRRDRRLDQRLRELRAPLTARLLSLQRRLRAAELSVLIPTTLLLSLAAGRTGSFNIALAACCVGAVSVLLLLMVIHDRSELRRKRLIRRTASRLTFPEP